MKKSPKENRIDGDVNVKNGDVVAGDKTVIHGDDNNILDSGTPSKDKRARKVKGRDLKGNLDVSGGDVVFGDKIIRFFQENLNIYVFKDIKQLAFFLTVVIFVSGGIGGGIWYSKQPQKMNGDFNIAIAQFGEIRDDGKIKPSARAENISNNVLNFLDSEYKSANLKVMVSHKNIPLILEDIQAEELAWRINADMIIYGNVYIQGEKAELSPRFYLSDHPDTQELTGQNELAYPIPFATTDLGSNDKVNVELKTQTAILVDFTKGLIYLSQKDMESASSSIQTAIKLAENAPKPFAGQEVLYLLAAQIQRRQKNYGAANDLLDMGLSLNPQYARAYLARGNIYYLQALDKNYDYELLNKALVEYKLAYQVPGQPESAYIPAKAHTALGNVLVVMAQQSNNPDLFAEAIEHYGYIVEQYERTQNPVLRANTAIAYFGLGVAYERQGQLERAVNMYEQAHALTDDQEFKNRIQGQIKIVQDK